jgi:quinoprotein dehydrogenase-associated probable ABC transporter substrate-binding protein
MLVGFASAARSFGADAHFLRVCADPNNLPFSNQQSEGLENKLAQIVSHDLSLELKYVWFSERKNFLKNSLGAGLCDAVLGVPIDIDDALVTRPYYRSTYVVVTRADRYLKIESLYDPQLKDLRIGVHVLEDDYAPPAHLLAAQGLSGNIVGYSLFGAYGVPNPPARLVDAVAAGVVDVAIVWGPFAGYFARTSATPLSIESVSPNRFQMIPFTYSIGVAVRKGNDALRDAIQNVLDKECSNVQKLLKEYRFPIPREDAVSCATLPSAAASLH